MYRIEEGEVALIFNTTYTGMMFNGLIGDDYMLQCLLEQRDIDNMRVIIMDEKEVELLEDYHSDMDNAVFFKDMLHHDRVTYWVEEDHPDICEWVVFHDEVIHFYENLLSTSGIIPFISSSMRESINDIRFEKDEGIVVLGFLKLFEDLLTKSFEPSYHIDDLKENFTSDIDFRREAYAYAKLFEDFKEGYV